MDFPSQGVLTLKKHNLDSEIEILRQQVQDLQDQLAQFQNKGGLPDYRQLFERSADANLIIDGDTFVDCNEATVKMLRYATRAELLQTHPSELSPEFQPDGRISFEKANEMMAKAFAKGSHRFEWHHQRAGGGGLYRGQGRLCVVPAAADRARVAGS